MAYLHEGVAAHMLESQKCSEYVDEAGAPGTTGGAVESL